MQIHNLNIYSGVVREQRLYRRLCLRRIMEETEDDRHNCLLLANSGGTQVLILPQQQPLYVVRQRRDSVVALPAVAKQRRRAPAVWVAYPQSPARISATWGGRLLAIWRGRRREPRVSCIDGD